MILGKPTVSHTVSLLQGNRGLKYYECSNQLGSALKVVSDQKLGENTNDDGIANGYDATIVSGKEKTFLLDQTSITTSLIYPSIPNI